MKTKHTIFQKRNSKIWNVRNTNHIRWNEQLSIVCEELQKTEDVAYANKLIELRNNMILDYNDDIIEPVTISELTRIYKFVITSDIISFLI